MLILAGLVFICVHLWLSFRAAFGFRGFGARISALAEWFWKGCKPNFVCALRRRESFVLATDTRNPAAFAALERAVPWIPYLVLHPTGFSVPCRLRFTRCALTAPFHHHHAITRESHGGAVCFLWHCPSASLEACRPRVSRSQRPGYAASRPVEFGLSSPGLRRERFSALPKPWTA